MIIPYILFLCSNFRHLACEEDRIEEAKMLDHYGARVDIEVENKKKATALLVAPNNSTVKILERMLQVLDSGAAD